MIYLLDYENVRNLTWLNDLTNADRVIIFYTKNANTLTFDEHEILQKTEAKIEYKGFCFHGKRAKRVKGSQTKFCKKDCLGRGEDC